MKQRILTSLTAALLTATVGTVIGDKSTPAVASNSEENLTAQEQLSNTTQVIEDVTSVEAVPAGIIEPPTESIVKQEAAGKPKAKSTSADIAQQGIKQVNGRASWYGPGFHGRRTANGERYNQYSLTAAHRSLPFGTKVRVTNLRNGRSVVVRINDRGPFIGGRVIDLSKGAARAIGMMSGGVGAVRLEILGR